MGTLLNRLKPEILKAIELDEKLYPNMIKKLKDDLRKECSILCLSVNTAANICQYNNDNLGLFELQKCFKQ